MQVRSESALGELVALIGARGWKIRDYERDDIEHEAFALKPWDYWPSWTVGMDAPPADWANTLERVASFWQAHQARQMVDELVALRSVRP